MLVQRLGTAREPSQRLLGRDSAQWPDLRAHCEKFPPASSLSSTSSGISLPEDRSWPSSLLRWVWAPTQQGLAGGRRKECRAGARSPGGCGAAPGSRAPERQLALQKASARLFGRECVCCPRRHAVSPPLLTKWNVGFCGPWRDRRFQTLF